jgi:hypothetical protein
MDTFVKVSNFDKGNLLLNNNAFSFIANPAYVFFGGNIWQSALFAGVLNNSGIFVIVRYNEFVSCKCNSFFV